MSYKKDLEVAKTFDECQSAYDKECQQKFARLEKTLGYDLAFLTMVAQDYSIWIKAQERLLELFPELENSYDFDEKIKSRY